MGLPDIKAEINKSPNQKLMNDELLRQLSAFYFQHFSFQLFSFSLASPQSTLATDRRASQFSHSDKGRDGGIWSGVGTAKNRLALAARRTLASRTRPAPRRCLAPQTPQPTAVYAAPTSPGSPCASRVARSIP